MREADRKNLFQLESLEQRVLLSSDGLLSGAADALVEIESSSNEEDQAEVIQLQTPVPAKR